MYRYRFYDLKVHFWWPNKHSFSYKSSLNTLYLTWNMYIKGPLSFQFNQFLGSRAEILQILCFFGKSHSEINWPVNLLGQMNNWNEKMEIPSKFGGTLCPRKFRHPCTVCSPVLSISFVVSANRCVSSRTLLLSIPYAAQKKFEVGNEFILAIRFKFSLTIF